jgi:uncharacterized protein
MLIGTLREEVWSRGHLRSRVRAGKAEPGAKFADYFEFSEPLAKLPSHRILALFRGEKEGVLILELVPDLAAPDRGEPNAFERQIANRFKVADHSRPADRWLIDTVGLAWRTRILVHIESDLRLRLWQVAEDAAVQVFAGTCATCCSRLPRVRVRRWVLIPGIGPASKSPWSPGPGKSPRRRQFTRMSRSVVGTSRLLSWRGLPKSIGWN